MRVETARQGAGGVAGRTRVTRYAIASAAGRWGENSACTALDKLHDGLYTAAIRIRGDLVKLHALVSAAASALVAVPPLGAGLAAGLLILGTPGQMRATHGPHYPDLKTRPAFDLRYDRVTIDGTTQWVLRFSNTVWNAGTGPLHLVPVNSGSKTTVWQHIYSTTTATGTPVEQHNVGEAEFHPEHNHWHFQNFAKYELYTKADWDGRTGQKRGEGVKTTFCIIDYTWVSGTLPATYTQCEQTSVTGLTVGWGDTYGAHLADQWVVVGQSRLADGQYVLRSIADPLNKLKESANNGAAETIDHHELETYGSGPPRHVRSRRAGVHAGPAAAWRAGVVPTLGP